MWSIEKICGNCISTKFSLPEIRCNYGILRSRVIIYISACASFPHVVFAAVSNIGRQMFRRSLHVFYKLGIILKKNKILEEILAQ